MAKSQKRRSSYLSVPQFIGLERTPIIVWGYDQKENFVCRLEINGAGLEVYAGEKGGKCLLRSNWERLVEDLEKAAGSRQS